MERGVEQRNDMNWLTFKKNPAAAMVRTDYRKTKMDTERPVTENTKQTKIDDTGDGGLAVSMVTSGQIWIVFEGRGNMIW